MFEYLRNNVNKVTPWFCEALIILAPPNIGL